MNESVVNKYHALLFDARRSIRYHNKRRMFFDRLNHKTNSLAALDGSTVIIAIITANQTPAMALAAAMAITAGIHLAFGSPQLARRQTDHARKFFDLEKDIISSEENGATLKAFTARRLNIQAEEPPTLRILDISPFFVFC